MAIPLRWRFSMALHRNPYTRSVIVFTRIVLIKLRTRPRRWRSWRRHHLVLGVGYFALSYAKLEQRFIEEAWSLALRRFHANHESDEGASHDALKQYTSISLGDLKKAAVWARQARQMSNDKHLMNEVERALSRMAALSPHRHAIIHYFYKLGDWDTVIWPNTYVQAHQWVKADPKTELGRAKLKVPIINRYTYSDLKRLDAEALALTSCIADLSERLREDFYRTTREKKGQVTDG